MSAEKDVDVLSQLVARRMMAYYTGSTTFHGRRNISEALGYPDGVGYAQMRERYARQEIARAIIDKPVEGTWTGDLILEESNDDRDTIFEKQWLELDDYLGLRAHFERLDKLTSLGEYGILLLGLSDTPDNTTFALPAQRGAKLLYVRAYGQNSVGEYTTVKDATDPRYGMPEKYNIILDGDSSMGTQNIWVHHSRIIHVVLDPLESDVVGDPALLPVWNRLLDLEKIVGGDAETFWLNARPGYQNKVEDGYTMTEDQQKKLKEQYDEYEHGLRRMLITHGVDMQALHAAVHDPKTHVDVQIQMISAETGIPKRILTGSERGELASTQDKNEWSAYLQSRRDKYAETRIVRPFVDRLQTIGILPETPTGYTVKWSDLFARSEKEKADIGKTRAEAIRDYTANPLTVEIVPVKAFYEFCLGLDAAQITLIDEMRDAEISMDDIDEGG